jgi:hypothetical protein
MRLLSAAAAHPAGSEQGHGSPEMQRTDAELAATALLEDADRMRVRTAPSSS